MIIYFHVVQKYPVDLIINIYSTHSYRRIKYSPPPILLNPRVCHTQTVNKAPHLPEMKRWRGFNFPPAIMFLFGNLILCSVWIDGNNRNFLGCGVVYPYKYYSNIFVYRQSFGILFNMKVVINLHIRITEFRITK